MWDLRWLWGTLLYKMNCCNSPDSVQYVQVHQQPAGNRKHMVTTNLKSEYLHRLTRLVNSKGNSPCQTFMPNAISRATRLEAKSCVSWIYRGCSCYMQDIWPGKVFKLCKTQYFREVVTLIEAFIRQTFVSMQCICSLYNHWSSSSMGSDACTSSFFSDPPPFRVFCCVVSEWRIQAMRYCRSVMIVLAWSVTSSASWDDLLAYSNKQQWIHIHMCVKGVTIHREILPLTAVQCTRATLLLQPNICLTLKAA